MSDDSESYLVPQMMIDVSESYVVPQMMSDVSEDMVVPQIDVVFESEDQDMVVPKTVIFKEDLEEKLADIKIKKECMNKLVMNYILTEGYPGTAEKFKQESGILQINPMNVTKGLLIRKSITEGNIHEAIEILNDLNPEILAKNIELFFHLQLQKYIELIRNKEFDKALEFTRQEIVPIAEVNPNFHEELKEAFSLIIFDKPEGPLKKLLDQDQRAKIANEVNAAILASQHHEPESKLETLLKILIWAEIKLDVVLPCVHDDLSIPPPS